MDPRDRAEALLSRARERGTSVVTPDNMVSPMDASNTQQIPGAQVDALDAEHDPDTTTVLPSSVIEEHVHHLAEPNPTTPLEESVPSQSSQDERQDAPRTEQSGELDGLVPTRTTQTGRSNLQNRLEGH